MLIHHINSATKLRRDRQNKEWCRASFILTSGKNGVESHELTRELGGGGASIAGVEPQANIITRAWA